VRGVRTIFTAPSPNLSPSGGEEYERKRNDHRQTRNGKTRPMRAEAQAMVNEIEESLVLLRRRL
jgi:hypothetical protein